MTSSLQAVLLAGTAALAVALGAAAAHAGPYEDLIAAQQAERLLSTDAQEAIEEAFDAVVTDGVVDSLVDAVSDAE